jgi:mannose-6-phosphate isomerase
VPDVSNRILQCRYFTANYIELTRAIDKDYNAIDSFVVFMCLEGSFSLNFYENEAERIQKGETVLLPAEIKNIRLVPESGARLLEIYIESDSPEKRVDDVISKYF